MNKIPQSDNSTEFVSRTLFLVLAILPFATSILKYSQWEIYGVFDFYTFHHAGTLANNGQAYLAYNWLEFVSLFEVKYGDSSNLPWFYPPILLPYCQLLALFEVSTAYLVFCFSGLISYYLTVYYLFHDKYKEIIVLSVFPLLIPIAFGHPTIFFLVFLLLGYRLSQNYPVLALIALTLVAAKPHVGGVILFLYFLKTIPKSILPSLAIAVIAIASTSLFYGTNIWMLFLSQIKTGSENLHTLQLENHFHASFYNAINPYGLPTIVKWLLHFSVLTGLCGFGAYVFKDLKSDRFWVVAGIAAFFASPYIVLYDYVLLLLPLILVLINSDIQTNRPWVMAVLFIELIPMGIIGLPPAYKYNFLVVSVFTIAMLMIKVERGNKKGPQMSLNS